MRCPPGVTPLRLPCCLAQEGNVLAPERRGCGFAACHRALEAGRGVCAAEGWCGQRAWATLELSERC